LIARPKSASTEPPIEAWITDCAEGAVVSVLTTPRSSANRIGPVEEGALRVRVTAAAVDGAANAALIKLMSDATGVTKGRIELISGHSSRRKRVVFRGIAASELVHRLSQNED
jgi:uncharacterized protein (TIGR00251 family)